MNENRFVKFSDHEINKRYSQVHSISIRCPLSDSGIKELYNDCSVYFSKYFSPFKLTYESIPVIDLFGVFVNILTRCKLNEINNEYLTVIGGIINAFSNIKYVDLEFVDNETDLINSYENLSHSNDGDKTHDFMNVCKINIIQLVLSDMFSQMIVDMLNKIMMLNGVMSNSYLKREFVVYFGFDDWLSYISMFLKNNQDALDKLDNRIIDCLSKFPFIILKDKPIVKIVTNYSEI